MSISELEISLEREVRNPVNVLYVLLDFETKSPERYHVIEEFVRACKENRVHMRDMLSQ